MGFACDVKIAMQRVRDRQVPVFLSLVAKIEDIGLCYLSSLSSLCIVASDAVHMRIEGTM